MNFLNKNIIFLICIMILGSVMGCGNQDDNSSKEDEKEYVVVKIEKSIEIEVEELFEFKSKKSIALTDYSGLNIPEGVYTIGYTDSGYSVIWKSDDDKYAYDDCKFIYVEDEVSDSEVAYFGGKLGSEEGIGYKQFIQKYK